MSNVRGVTVNESDYINISESKFHNVPWDAILVNASGEISGHDLTIERNTEIFAKDENGNPAAFAGLVGSGIAVLDGTNIDIHDIDMYGISKGIYIYKSRYIR